jgi:hypothetical protein
MKYQYRSEDGVWLSKARKCRSYESSKAAKWPGEIDESEACEITHGASMQPVA